MTGRQPRGRPSIEVRKGGDRVWWRVVGAVVVRPRLWLVAGRQLRALAPPGWWRAAPRLPLPDPDYLAFRLETMYGDRARPPAPADVVAYLEWCRGQGRALR